MNHSTNLAATDRAQSILASSGIIELARGGYVVVDVDWSGKGHITTVDSCDCQDHQYRGRICKHMRAARMAASMPICRECGGYTRKECYYVGGRGYQWFDECTADKYHRVN